MVKIIHWDPQNKDIRYPYSFAMGWAFKTEIVNWIEENKIDVLFITETHKSISYDTVSFKTEEEAIGFKLRWV